MNPKKYKKSRKKNPKKLRRKTCLKKSIKKTPTNQNIFKNGKKKKNRKKLENPKHLTKITFFAEKNDILLFFQY